MAAGEICRPGGRGQRECPFVQFCAAAAACSPPRGYEKRKKTGPILLAPGSNFCVSCLAKRTHSFFLEVCPGPPHFFLVSKSAACTCRIDTSLFHLGQMFSRFAHANFSLTHALDRSALNPSTTLLILPFFSWNFCKANPPKIPVFNGRERIQ